MLDTIEELENLRSRILRDETRTIVPPGELAKLKETGRWSVRKSKGIDSDSSKKQKS